MIDDISRKFLKIEKDLNNDIIGEESYLNKLTGYFKGKFINNEKGVLFLAGEKNTAKKTSIKLLFQQLKKENLVNKSEIDELDLGAYNFNLGFNLFLTDLYEKLNSHSECLLFRNIDKADPAMINVLMGVYPNSCINLKEDYILKEKFFVEAESIHDNKINKFICHDKFFIFTFNTLNLDDIIDKNFKEKADVILYTRTLDQNEMLTVIKKEILKIFKNIEEELKLNVSLQIIEENQLREDLGLSSFLAENYRNDCNFGIEKYISYEIYKPIENLIRKQQLMAGEKIIIYAENNEIYCKAGEDVFKLSDYSVPTLEEARYKLNSIIGMKELKEFINNIENNYKVQRIREKLGLKTSGVVMNMIFAGNAGTGKTNAARVTFEYLNALGLLENGVFKEVSKADFVSENINDTAKRTIDIINSALGGVLFIDEAYSLCEGEEDKQGKEIIDALLKGLEDNRGNLIVIMAGYEKDMEVFLSINPGLKSRFPNVIHFQDYNPSEMYAIAKDIAKAKGYRISENVKNGLMDLFIRNQVVGKNDLGNARFVRNIVENAIIDASKKYLTSGKKEIDLLEKDNFNFKAKTKFNLEEKLKEIIGLEDVKNLLRNQYKLITAEEKRKSAGINTKIEQNLNMVFAGNPGTGKTSIARLVAEMLNSMGFLKAGQLIETDRSSFVSEVPGETAKKTEEKFREALGGILFIDEAYTLAGDSLGREAIETLLKLIEDYSREVIVILAGYEKEMENFFDVNIGLKSRFPLWTRFEDYNADELFQMAIKLIEAEGFKLSKNAYASLKKNFVDIYENSDSQSGNGRMVRNYVEKLIRAQSIRISENDISVYEMNLITAKDIEKISAFEFDSKFDLEERLNTLKVNEKAKHFLRKQYSVIKAESKRRKFGIRSDINKDMNMIFTGDIGTGKRAVLSILAEMYYSMGIVNSKVISELNGNEIIYMMDKGENIENILNKQLGKIVYIDNADLIFKDERYKITEISLLKFIDNNRGKIIITMAGQSREMKKLILSDPWLNSKFPLWLDFDNYSLDELVDFSMHILNSKGFIVNKDGENAITEVLKDIYKNNNLSLKNGLMVESFIDTLIRTQSIRISNENISQKEINIIIPGDIIAAREEFLSRNIY